MSVRPKWLADCLLYTWSCCSQSMKLTYIEEEGKKNIKLTYIENIFIYIFICIYSKIHIYIYILYICKIMCTIINKQRTVKLVSGITLTRIWTLGTYYLMDKYNFKQKDSTSNNI